MIETTGLDLPPMVYTPPPDDYAAHRRPCGHLVYADETAEDPCRWGCPPPESGGAE